MIKLEVLKQIWQDLNIQEKFEFELWIKTQLNKDLMYRTKENERTN